MNDALRKKIESEGWNIHETETQIELSQYSPAGEDFSFCIDNGNNNEIMAQICEYSNGFDVDEHARLWIDNPGHGQPGSIRNLIEDAEAIAEMLKELKETVNN